VSGEAHTPEHSIEVELPFLQTVAPECQIVPLVFGELDSDLINRVARHLLTLWDDETVVVVSSDFTHYGESFNYLPFSPEAAPTKLEELDAGAIDRILEQDTQGFMDYVSETGATICGRLPIAVLLAAMSDRDIDCKATLLQYTNSGRILNDYRNSVSYAAIAFRRDCDVGDGGAPALTQEDRKCLFGIVRGTIEGVLYSRPYALPESLPKRLLQTRATFVTLRKHGELRGCIGGTSATEPLPECLQASALGAAFKDPRFPPLTADEWPDVTIAISVLSEARPIDGADNFEPGRHGIIMEYKDKHAVFLPKVAVDHGWDRGTTLSYLSKKAGLARDAWRSDAARFHVFEADEFSEGEGAG
jgi:AmmeMemoRadiSam system protein A